MHPPDKVHLILAERTADAGVLRSVKLDWRQNKLSLIGTNRYPRIRA
jgi:hypothetical protein